MSLSLPYVDTLLTLPPRHLVQQVGRWRQGRCTVNVGTNNLRHRLLTYSRQTLSQTRCVISRDAGYTRADATNNRFCCLFFARGRCPYG